jgi:hypothetical protein
MVLLGAVINSQSEKKTRKDSTVVRRSRWDNAMPGRLTRLAMAGGRAASMAGNSEIDRLQRRLRREAAGPLTEISNQATGSLFSGLSAGCNGYADQPRRDR